MTDLRALQKDFLDYLLYERQAVCERMAASNAAGLRVYADGYRLRLIEALDDSYPVLHALVGEKAFRDMALGYIDSEPSRHFSIRWFGDRLGAYLTNTPRYACEPVLAEMAAFEWTLREVFDAANSPVLGLDALRGVAPDQWAGLRFRPHPSLRRLSLQWNVPALWRAIDAGEQPPAAERTPLRWLIWRQDLQTYFRSLTVHEAAAVEGLCAGRSFGEICAELAGEDNPEAAAEAAGWLAGWIENGLIGGLL